MERSICGSHIEDEDSKHSPTVRTPHHPTIYVLAPAEHCRRREEKERQSCSSDWTEELSVKYRIRSLREQIIDKFRASMADTCTYCV